MSYHFPGKDASGNDVTISMNIRANLEGGGTLGQEIKATPANWDSIIVNDDSVNYAGSTSEYRQVNGGHTMLAIPCNFENVEIEAEVMYYAGNPATTDNLIIQLQSRTWHHGDQYMCDGRAYKGAFRPTDSRTRKELFHRSSSLLGGSGYCDDKVVSPKPYAQLKGRWAKLKFRTINLPPVGGITPVLLQNFVDGIKVHEYIDNGNWSWPRASGGSNQPICYPCQYGNTGNRKPNEILNKPGEWIIARSDGDTVPRYRYIAAREIIV